MYIGGLLRTGPYVLPLTMAEMSAEVTFAAKFGTPKPDRSELATAAAAADTVTVKHVEGNSASSKTASGDAASTGAATSGAAPTGPVATGTAADGGVIDPAGDVEATAQAPTAISLPQRVDVYV